MNLPLSFALRADSLRRQRDHQALMLAEIFRN
jgi:hypothetical protein